MEINKNNININGNQVDEEMRRNEMLEEMEEK